MFCKVAKQVDYYLNALLQMCNHYVAIESAQAWLTFQCI